MPLFDLFFTILYLFLLFAWFWVLISIISDIFRSDDMGGGAKALWVVFVILLPLIGVLTYVIARGQGMTERTLRQAAAQEQQAQDYIRSVATTSPAEEIAKLAELRNSGAITEEEFAAQKAKLLG